MVKNLTSDDVRELGRAIKVMNTLAPVNPDLAVDTIIDAVDRIVTRHRQHVGATWEQAMTNAISGREK